MSSEQSDPVMKLLKKQLKHILGNASTPEEKLNKLLPEFSKLVLPTACYGAHLLTSVCSFKVTKSSEKMPEA